MYLHTINIYMLKSIFKFIIIHLLFSTSFVSVFAQNIELEIIAKDSIRNYIIQDIPYNKVHLTRESAITEIDAVSNQLVKRGYIHNQYHLTEIDSLIECQFTINEKIELIRIYYPANLIEENFVKKIALHTTKSFFEIPFDKVEPSLNAIAHYFENKGHSFTTVSLTNLLETENILTAQLQLAISEKRTIDNVVIKGYPEFPKKYLKHYLSITPNSTFNLNSLNELNDQINTIPFVNQI